METAIMHRLQNSILRQSSLLIDVVHHAAELDWLVRVDHLTCLSLTLSTTPLAKLPLTYLFTCQHLSVYLLNHALLVGNHRQEAYLFKKGCNVVMSPTCVWYITLF